MEGFKKFLPESAELRTVGKPGFIINHPILSTSVPSGVMANPTGHLTNEDARELSEGLAILEARQERLHRALEELGR